MPRKRASYRNRDIGGPPQDQPWSWYSVEMMRSDAWRDMSVNARRMLDLLEIEHLAHGGYENGNLVMTYDQFVTSGIRRASIFATITELERLGWIEVSRGGYRGFARSWPHRFRLTHRRTRIRPGVGAPTWWRGPTIGGTTTPKNQNRMVPEPVPPQFRNRHYNGKAREDGSSDSAASGLTASVPVPEPLYRSRAEGGGEGRSAGGRVVARVTHGPVTHFPAEAFVACRSVIQCRVRRARPRWCGSAWLDRRRCRDPAALATAIIYRADATLAAATVKIDIERIADGFGDSPNRE